MQRKTNIFYNSGVDSKFLTFSNYTECMTGNFLSTNYKMFPSKFMCFYWEVLDDRYIEENIDSLLTQEIKKYIALKQNKNANDITLEDYNNNKNDYISLIKGYHKELLIQYLQCYYENKLAFLRDYCIKNEDFYDLNNPSQNDEKDIHPENKVYPLSYLFETLYKLGIVKLTTETTSTGDVLKYYKIEYISNITEQDYKGTYADTICIVDLASNYKGKLKPAYYFNENIENDDTKKEFSQLINTNDEKLLLNYYNENSNYYNIFGNDPHIYGWTQDELNTLYSDSSGNSDKEKYATPIFDVDVSYYIDNEWSNINIYRDDNETEMKFNLIVPLFDIVNIDYTTAESKIINIDGTLDILEEDINFSDIDNDNPYNKNVPLGIWISDDVVSIKKDESTNYSPVWSLVISSQFKPFPYGNISNINKTDIPIEYNTYAQIIANQNSLFNAISDLNVRFTEFYKEFENFKSQTTNLATQYNIGGFKNQITNIEKSLKEQYSNLETQLTNVVNDLKWKGMY